MRPHTNVQAALRPSRKAAELPSSSFWPLDLPTWTSEGGHLIVSDENQAHVAEFTELGIGIHRSSRASSAKFVLLARNFDVLRQNIRPWVNFSDTSPSRVLHCVLRTCCTPSSFQQT